MMSEKERWIQEVETITSCFSHTHTHRKWFSLCKHSVCACHDSSPHIPTQLCSNGFKPDPPNVLMQSGACTDIVGARPARGNRLQTGLRPSWSVSSDTAWSRPPPAPLEDQTAGLHEERWIIPWQRQYKPSDWLMGRRASHSRPPRRSDRIRVDLWPHSQSEPRGTSEAAKMCFWKWWRGETTVLITWVVTLLSIKTISAEPCSPFSIGHCNLKLK